MFASGWYNHRLAGSRYPELTFHPYFSVSVQHCQDFLNGMQVSGRSPTRGTPLLELAELRRPIQDGHPHPRPHALSPELDGLLLMIKN
jgi:hypothetical protein